MEHRKITVAFFLPSLEAGGTEKSVVNLVNTIDKEKYSVSIMLGSMKGDFIGQVRQGIPMINLHAPRSLWLFFKLVHYFKTQKPDIFVSAFPRINIICLLAKMWSGSSVKMVITEHSVFSFLPVIAKTPFRRFFARFFVPLLVKVLYPKADAIICVSRGIAYDLAKIVNASKKIKVIYNPVINDNIYRLAQAPIEHEWFLNSQIPIIIAVGRLVSCKDYPTLLGAFKMVLQTKPVRLVILGSGPEKDRLINLARQMGLADNVAFLGFQENPFKYMAGALVFVLSSLQEGFGNVIIEAMACRAPVVSTDCPTGPGEIISQGENGLLVPVGDQKALAGAIQDVLNNPMLAEKLIAKGRERAEFFSVKKSVQEYEKVFELLC